MTDLTKTTIKVLDLLHEAKTLVENETESELYNDIQYVIHALKLECLQSIILTDEEKELIYN